MVKIYEGERGHTKHNHLLGYLKLEGISAARKRIPQLEVAFELDGDLTLTISATDKATSVILSFILLRICSYYSL